MSLVQNLNPVFDRELTQRSRAVRTPVILALYLALLLAIMSLVYFAERSAEPWMSPDERLLQQARTGRIMFDALLLAELGLLMLIVPAFAASSVSGERDRQTLIPLQITMLGPDGIFWGKVAASASFAVLLVVASMPVITVPYLIGGFSLSQVFASVAMLIFLSVVYAVIGVGCSTVFKRSVAATLSAYLTMGALTIGTLLVFVAIGLAVFTDGDSPTGLDFWPLYANPVVTLAGTAPVSGDGFFGDESFLEGIHRALTMDWDGEETTGFPPLWIRTVAANLAVAVPFALLGRRRLSTPSNKISE